MAADIFKKGSIEMLVLLLLCEADSYGYQIVQSMAKRSGGKLTVQEGSLYPVLYRLSENGYVCSQETLTKTHTGRSRIRVMYSVTDTGRAHLRELKKEYETIHEGIRAIFNSSEVQIDE